MEKLHLANLKKYVCGSLIQAQVLPYFSNKGGVTTKDLPGYFRVSLQGHILSKGPPVGVRGFPGRLHCIVKAHARQDVDLDPKGPSTVDSSLNTELKNASNIFSLKHHTYLYA